MEAHLSLTAFAQTGTLTTTLILLVKASHVGMRIVSEAGEPCTTLEQGKGGGAGTIVEQEAQTTTEGLHQSYLGCL